MPSEVFEKHAEEYDSWYWGKGYRAYLMELRCIRALGLQGLGLEVGVGTGAFATPLGVQVGVEPSLAMGRKAAERGVQVVRGVGEKLPFRSAAFDHVLVVVTICFADQPALLLREAARVLRGGGKVVVGMVPRDSWLGRRYVEEGRRGHVFYSVARFFTVEEVWGMMRRAGLQRGRLLGVLGEGGAEGPVRDCSKCGFVCMEGVKPMG